MRWFASRLNSISASYSGFWTPGRERCCYRPPRADCWEGDKASSSSSCSLQSTVYLTFSFHSILRWNDRFSCTLLLISLLLFFFSNILIDHSNHKQKGTQTYYGASEGADMQGASVQRITWPHSRESHHYFIIEGVDYQPAPHKRLPVD